MEPIKLVSSIICEEVIQDPGTLKISLIGISASNEVDMPNDSPVSEYKLPDLIACFTFTRSNPKDICDDLVSVETILSLQLNGKLIENSERSVTIRIPEGKFSCSEFFSLPNVKFKEIPSEGLGIQLIAAILRTKESDEEIGRVEYRILIDRRFSSSIIG